MIDDVIADFQNKCTYKGQFYIASNIWIMLFIVFTIGGFLAVFIYNLLGSDCLDSIRIILSFIVLVLVLIIYLVFVFYFVYRKKKKIVIEKIGSLIYKEDLNDTIKQRGENILKEINNSKFSFSYIRKNEQVEKMFGKIKFVEFLKSSNIDINNYELIIKNLNAHTKDKNNYKDIIDTTFWGLVFVIGFTPVVEYAQGVFIPKTSTSINSDNFFMYLFFVISLIVIAFFANDAIHKANFSVKYKYEKIIIGLSDNLSNYNYKNKEEDYYFASDNDYRRAFVN